ncbi:MAG: ORF6N domain-containing protein [Pseudomonadota bacterium]
MVKKTGNDPPMSTSPSTDLVFELRGRQVMLASRVAEVFEVETRQIVQNVKNNPHKFPERYAFEVTREELESLRSSGMIPKPGRGGSRALPWVVTQKGAIRLATLMDVPKAIEAADTFVDVFTEVLIQVYRGKRDIEISQPSRIAPDEEATKQAFAIRKGIAIAVDDLLDTVVDTKTNATVKDELGEVARGVRTHLKEWLDTRKVQNDKIEAETILILEQARDLYERRQADLEGAALDREGKALENMERKIALVGRLLDMHDRLEPNTVVRMVGSYVRPTPGDAAMVEHEDEDDA